MVWFVLGHSGQRTSVKCTEAARNCKIRGHSALKITYGLNGYDRMPGAVNMINEWFVIKAVMMMM